MNKISETAIANNGMLMTIVAYRNDEDIDVQFENGTIVENQRYDDFKNGNIIL